MAWKSRCTILLDLIIKEMSNFSFQKCRRNPQNHDDGITLRPHHSHSWAFVGSRLVDTVKYSKNPGTSGSLAPPKMADGGPVIICPPEEALQVQNQRNVPCAEPGCGRIFATPSSQRFHMIKVHKRVEVSRLGMGVGGGGGQNYN